MSWEALSAIGAIATPVVVLGLGYYLASHQERSGELLRAQVEYYKTLVPKLNQLMCYVTFIGNWRDLSPVQVVALKRDLDREFYCALPLFSEPVAQAYEAFMLSSFQTFNAWGSDPQILSSGYRRRKAWRPADTWDPQWDQMFTKEDTDRISGDELQSIRKQYDDLVGAMARDLNLKRVRSQYTSGQVSLNAHAPTREDISGAPPSPQHAADPSPFHESLGGPQG